VTEVVGRVPYRSHVTVPHPGFLTSLAWLLGKGDTASGHANHNFHVRGAATHEGAKPESVLYLRITLVNEMVVFRV
jgi:hypothetical protein